MRSAGSPGGWSTPAPWRRADTPSSGAAACTSSEWTARGPSSGRSMRSRSARAATSAAAALVPVSAASRGAPSGPRPGQAASRATAGATRSGFWRPSVVGPHDENEAMTRGASAGAPARSATVSPGWSAASRARPSPCWDPIPITGSGRAPSSGTAGKLAGPATSHTASAAAPAAAAWAAFSAIVPPPRATTAIAPVTRLAPSGPRYCSGASPVARPSGARSSTTGSAAPSGSGPMSGRGPSRALAGPRSASRSAVRGARGADRPPTAMAVGVAAGPPTEPGRA